MNVRDMKIGDMEIGRSGLRPNRLAAHAAEFMRWRIDSTAVFTVVRRWRSLRGLQRSGRGTIQARFPNRRWRRIARARTHRVFCFQFTQKFEYGLVSFFRRTAEINLGPPAHILAEDRIEQRV